MKCAVHAEVDAVGYCRNCGKALCGTCVRPVRDVFYCEDCLAAIAGVAPPPAAASPYSQAAAVAPPPAPAARRSSGSPALAFFLGFCFPGLGAVYNGEYNKALIHIVVFTTMAIGLSSDIGDGATVALAILLAGFIFYMGFDAMRVAKAKNTGEAIDDPLENWSKDRPVGPIILIVVGSLFLLNNFDFFPFFKLDRFWPVILIAIGVLMFRRRLNSRS